jgi:putative transcriptional regulator
MPGATMNEKLFVELVQSVREGGTILKGEAEPSRAFEVDRPTIKEIRKTADLSEAELATQLGVSVDTLQAGEQRPKLESRPQPPPPEPN